MVPLLAGPIPIWMRPTLRRLAAVVAAVVLAVLGACWWC